jgi:hypothetical protein
MRTFVKVFLAAVCSLLLFVVGFLATFMVNIWIYGAEEFNHNAGAGFAVLLEGLLLVSYWPSAEYPCPYSS